MKYFKIIITLSIVLIICLLAIPYLEIIEDRKVSEQISMECRGNCEGNKELTLKIEGYVNSLKFTGFLYLNELIIPIQYGDVKPTTLFPDKEFMWRDFIGQEGLSNLRLVYNKSLKVFIIFDINNSFLFYSKNFDEDKLENLERKFGLNIIPS